jgi:hypothetical protein
MASAIPSWAVKLIEDMGELKGINQQILEQTQKTNGRVTKLESRVDVIESKNDTAAGAKAIKSSFWNHCWDIGKIAMGALVGLLVGGLKK